MKSFADKVIRFNQQLKFNGSLPPGIRIMNPFIDNAEAIEASIEFYRKFYDDVNPRHLILGINPGRFGAAITGVPFTDSKRLRSECNIAYHGKESYELSSVFVYDVIKEYGGPEAFYKDFYITSVCPLGFTDSRPNGREVNYNYYDSRELTQAVYEFIISCIQKQIALGINTETCFCFGKGKNERFLKKVNDQHKFFGKVIALEHPRFIMQYKLKSKQFYIDKYIGAFRN